MILRLDDLDLIIKLVSLGILLILNALLSAAEALLARLTRDNILKFAEEGGRRYEVLTPHYCAIHVATRSPLSQQKLF